MSQIALPFIWPPTEDERDFIVTDANRAAVRFLERRGLWPVRAALLVGPRKSGRSLLGRLFVGRAGAMLMDDAQDKDEEALFHAWNAAQNDRRHLLLIADEAPPVWHVSLPDLRSRLAATPVVRIDEPDDALVRALVEKLLVRRGLPALPAVVSYVANRVERSYVGVHRAVDALDEAALRRRGGATMGAAREALAQLPVIDDSHVLR